MRSTFVGGLLVRTLHPTQLVVLSFAGAILAGAFLLMTPWASTGVRTSFVDALFTATSATCVTGLAVVDTGTHFTPFGQWVVLALIQLGGLGIMTYSSVFLLVMGGRLSFKSQFILEDTLGRKARTSAQKLVRDVFVYTFAIEVAGAALLTLVFARSHGLGYALYSGVFHSVSAFCNAGFSLYPKNLEAYRGDWIVNFTVMGLIVVGGLGFTVLEDLYDAWVDWRMGRPLRLRLHSKIVLATTIVLIVVGAIGVWVCEHRNVLSGLDWDESLLACLFQSITPRTAGFNTLNYAVMTNTTLFLTILLMFIGASPGSCAGGIKTSTFAVVGALFKDRLMARQRVSIFRRTLPDDTVSRAVAILIASFVFVTVMTVGLLATEVGPTPYREGGGSFLGLFFETVSAFGTVGLSAGVTPSLSAPGKLLITFVMFVGRVGPLTLAMAVGRKAERGKFRFAEENVMVG